MDERCVACRACHHADVLPYAAYLRVYEPLAAFAEPERSFWAEYVVSADRPRRATALGEEHARAVRRLAARPPELAPDQECRDAYVRRGEDGTFVCPWQTRLRSWQAVERLRDTAPQGLADAAGPGGATDRVLAEFARWRAGRVSARTHIRSCTWHVPASWFVPFAPAERRLALGPGTGGGAGGAGSTAGTGGPAVAEAARALLYVTSMARARRRVAEAVSIVRERLGEGSIFGHIDGVGRWLSEFHPASLVELDYGGLVQLLDDQALRSDESVAELAAALTGLARGEPELTHAMYSRLAARWRPVQALESAN